MSGQFSTIIDFLGVPLAISVDYAVERGFDGDADVYPILSATGRWVRVERVSRNCGLPEIAGKAVIYRSEPFDLPAPLIAMLNASGELDDAIRDEIDGGSFASDDLEYRRAG